jgi:hypothetical protein
VRNVATGDEEPVAGRPAQPLERPVCHATAGFDRANLDGTVADEGPKDDPSDVARDGLEAMFGGKDQVVAGSWRNTVQAVLSKGGPDSLKAAMHAQQTKEK